LPGSPDAPGGLPFMVKISRDLAIVTLSTLICLIFNGLPSAAPAQECFQTHRAIIYCAFPADLYLMEKKVQFVPSGRCSLENYGASGGSADPALNRLAAKVDGMMDRVSHLLNIRPQSAPKLRIFLLKDGRQVRERYHLFQPGRGEPLLGHQPLEGFYQPGTHTLFLSLADLHEGILAHEMAHYLLCTCMAAPPPAGMQERWARYAETHLR
jgi:hypothetical protein